VWAETFDRELKDIFETETAIAKAIVERLQAELTGREEQAITARPTENFEAYRAYQRGLAFTMNSANTPANALGARAQFREAVRLDAQFALAWAWLSYTNAVGYRTQTLEATDSLREEAGRAADMALKLQPELGEAIWAKGYYHYSCLEDYEVALRYFEQARRLLPNDSRIREALAYVARRRGEWEKCEKSFSEAERIDPRNINVLTQHALFYIAMRRFSEGSRKLDQVLDITPSDIEVIALKAAIAQAEGDLSRASELLRPLRPGAGNIGVIETQAYQAILEHRSGDIVPQLESMQAQLAPSFGFYRGELLFWLAWAEAESGNTSAARQSWQLARAELESVSNQLTGNQSVLNHLALTCLGLGDRESAFKFAQRAIAAKPVERDAIAGPGALETFVRVAAGFGEHDTAFDTLRKLLAMPYAGPLATQDLPLTPALLRNDPMFAALSPDKRFKELIGKP
jgi:tetratricopeptide (TPR) repeat protein